MHSNSRLSSTSSSASFDASANLPFRLLVQEVQRLAHDPFLADRFRDGVDKGEGDVFRNFDFPRFVERVGLRPLERLVLASSFVAAPYACPRTGTCPAGSVEAVVPANAAFSSTQPAISPRAGCEGGSAVLSS